MSNAFATVKAARSVGRRHPDVPAYVAAVAQCLASYGDGRSGTMIRPSLKRVAEDLGMSLSQVQRAVRWLESRNELRRDKTGWRGSAACFTWLGGMEVVDDPLLTLMEVVEGANGGRGRPPTNPTIQPSDPSDPSRPNSGPHQGYECKVCHHRASWLSNGRCPDCLDA